MADRIARKCSVPGCTTFGVFNGGRCPAHTNAGVTDRKSGRNLGKEWENLKGRLRGSGNTICQRIGPSAGESRADVRCSKPVEFFHHILDAQTYKQFELHQDNVVGVCASCHTTNPSAEDTGLYIPTLWVPPFNTEPLPQPLVLPGEMVPRELKALLWCVAERRKRFGV